MQEFSETPRTDFRAALLLHLVDWDEGIVSPISLGPGITYGKLEGSEIGSLYEKMCASDRVDEGEPYGYSTYFDVDENIVETGMDFQSPYALYMRLCNMVTICSERSIGMARLIISRDNYKTYWYTRQAFDYTFQDQQLDWHSPAKHDVNYLHLLNKYIELEKNLFDRWTHSSRVANALVYFCYSWRSYHVEPACINLSIVLESLFGPESTSELSHQIAFNVSRFVGTTAEMREDIYRKIKKFYSVRSKIIHGVVPDEDDVLEILGFAFPLLCSVLKRIMTNDELLNEFNSNRSALISRWLFA